LIKLIIFIDWYTNMSNTPNYSRLAVVKAAANKDPGNQTGDDLGIWLDCNNHQTSLEGSKITLKLNYIDGWACGSGGCARNPVPKKSSSKRWFVWYRLITNIHWNGGMQISHAIHIWDNHGQRYDHNYVEVGDPSYYKTLTIQEDTAKYPEPLSDLMIDFIKGAQLPFYRLPSHQRIEPSLFDFQTRLNHFYVSRESVRKDMAELEKLRTEVIALRAANEEQKKEIGVLRHGMETLEQTHRQTSEELAEQKALTKVLRMALEALEKKEKNNVCQPSEPICPVARLNPFDEL
jgi:hypothetical protein